MKKIYLLIYSLLSFLISDAQNYHPFPYDSVFFAESSDSKMLPLVKTGNAEDLFHLTNTKREIANRPFNPFTNTLQVYPIHNWLGKVSFTNNEISFIGIVNDTIKIDLNKNLNEKDTCQFSIPYLWAEDFVGYVEITYASKMYIDGDSIKEYTFAFYNDNFEPHNYDAFGFNPSESNSANYVFWISKNEGIIKTPDFNHFPFCKQYYFQGKITDYLDLSSSTHYKAYKMNVGDEIHTLEVKPSILFDEKWYAKRVLTEQTFNPSDNSYTNIFDYWELHSEIVNGENGYELVHTPSYEQQTEVLYIGTGDIPDGFPYLYNHALQQFISNDLSYASIWDDSIHVEFNDDTSAYYDSSKYLKIGLRGLYYNTSGASSYESNYNPVYYNISGEEWGVPFQDHFLLNLIENNNEPEVNFNINNHEILLSSNHNIQSLRIYNIQGSLRKICSSKDIEQPINIQNLEAGIYIICCWNGKKLYSYKFLKS